MDTKNKPKIIIIGGFLGSGKTSFLIHLARYLGKDHTVAIGENEIGKTSIDGQFLSASGLNVTNMFAGCICCSMSGTLPITIRKIETDFHPDYILLEATGVAFPLNIRENLKDTLDLDARIITLTDAVRFPKMAIAMKDMVAGQFAGADHILLNKTDLIEDDKIETLTALIKDFNQFASVHAVNMLNAPDAHFLAKLLEE